MLFEIINPSDKYTLTSDDFELACFATIVLGEGRWGLAEIGNDRKMPIFMLGGIQYADQWWTEQFGRPLQGLADIMDYSRIADVLDSVLIGGANDREAYEKGLELIDAPAKRVQWRDHWHDRRRTSTNDIGARAWALAKRLRQLAGERPEHGAAR